MKNSDILTDHILSILVYNKPGVMAKVTSLFTRRGFNIESISAGKAKENELMRFTIIVKGDDRSIEQIQKQLYKVLETVKVSPILSYNRVEREMGLIKLKAVEGFKSDLFQLAEVFRGKVVDASTNGFIIEITGPTAKIDAFINKIPKNLIIEIARTGVVAMNRWESQNLLKNHQK
jgi:acetolactate synthase-1/3 small subunit